MLILFPFGIVQCRYSLTPSAYPQREYMDISWGCGWFLAALFVFINLVGQLGGVAMVLLRLKVGVPRTAGCVLSPVFPRTGSSCFTGAYPTCAVFCVVSVSYAMCGISDAARRWCCHYGFIRWLSFGVQNSANTTHDTICIVLEIAS